MRPVERDNWLMGEVLSQTMGGMVADDEGI